MRRGGAFTLVAEVAGESVDGNGVDRGSDGEVLKGAGEVREEVR